MTMIDSTDTRFTRALALADTSGQWLKCRTADGGKAYGIRSSRDANRVYFVTTANCTCEDQRRRPGLPCKHRMAVAIHVARVRGFERPASDVVDGLTQMVVDRNPVLDMVRHEDGEISWARHEHADGTVTHLPDHAAMAAQYDSIFSRFEGASIDNPHTTYHDGDIFKRFVGD